MYSKDTNNNFKEPLDETYIEVNERGKNALLTGKLRILTSNIKNQYKTSLSLVFDIPDDLKALFDKKLLIPTLKFFRSINTDQIIYNKSLLHMTLFTFFSAESDDPFDSKSDNLAKYESLCLEVLKTAHPIKVRFSRVLLSENGVFLAGFPNTDEVMKIRHRIKDILDTENLRYYKGPKNIIAHVSFVRWKKQIPIEVRNDVLKFVDGLNISNEWITTFNRVDLVLGNSYSDGPTRKVVRSINLE